MSLAEIARTCLPVQVDALRAHEAGARLGEDQEEVHQMRVATRRLRAALRVFRDVLPPSTRELALELKWLADVLGAVRDLDVQLASLMETSKGLEAEPETVRAVLSLFQTRRAAAHAQLESELARPRYALLLGALDELLTQPWPDSVTAEPAAAELIRARHRRLRKAGQALGEDAPSEDLHRTRIRTKQLRYTIEFLSDLYGKPAKRVVRRAVRLQDVLGGLQDAVVLSERLRAASLPDHGLEPASVFLLGQLSEVYAEQVRAARAEVPVTYLRLMGRPWKRLARRMRASAPPVR